MAQSNCGRDGRMAPPGSNKRMGSEAGFVPRFCHHDTRGAPSISLAQKTRTIADFPIRHRGAAYNDPVGGGFVRSLARPGGNVTGFGGAEYGFSAKWLELLKQIAPRVTRVAIIRDPFGTGGPGFTGALQGV